MPTNERPTEEDLDWMRDFGNDLYRKCERAIRELRDEAKERDTIIKSQSGVLRNINDMHTLRGDEVVAALEDNAKLREKNKVLAESLKNDRFSLVDRISNAIKTLENDDG